MVGFMPERFYPLGEQFVVLVEGLGGRWACPTFLKHW